VALVTGAGRGIGRGIARDLAAAGARVMAVSRTEADLVSLHAEIGGAYLVVSLTDEAGCIRAVEETRARLGPVAILVNNAGDHDAADGRAWEVDPADWRAKLAVNVDAPFYLTRLVLPGMLDSGGDGSSTSLHRRPGRWRGHGDLRDLEARTRRIHARGRDRCRRRG
jgi:3-oxoacyl-[acyl-carrier protein] reductase